jgi:hypothetical protein
MFCTLGIDGTLLIRSLQVSQLHEIGGDTPDVTP